MNILSSVFVVCMHVSFLLHASYETAFVEYIQTYAPLSDAIFTEIQKLARPEIPYTRIMDEAAAEKLPLFCAFPQLREHISYISLADLPTPLQRCPELEKLFSVHHIIYCKCDNVTGRLVAPGERLFGGNKVRKLEFLLADALAWGATTVATFGNAGSNHACATAFYSKLLGLQCILFLTPQVHSGIVQRNLLLDFAAGALMTYAPNRILRSVGVLYHTYLHALNYGSFPYIIPTGGSSALGALGYVNAAFELKEQLAAGLMPRPDCIYVSLGSAGTAAGLLLGLGLAQLDIPVVAVAVFPMQEAGARDAIRKVYEEANLLLQGNDATIPLVSFDERPLRIVCTFAGSGYAQPTDASMIAEQTLQEKEGITVDSVYTAKMCAAMLDELHHRDNSSTVLFWNTFCADRFEDIVSRVSYTELPHSFHTYFE